MTEKAELVSGYMRTLSAPSRLVILCQLAQGERSAGALCELAGLNPPAMSQHLARMRHEGLLAARRDGRTIYYAVADPAILKIMQFLYETFCAETANQEGDTA
ncbi:MAG: metalloregulator ArsR/SmtB family transcription factor [Pseudomonadota bacterium]